MICILKRLFTHLKNIYIVCIRRVLWLCAGSHSDALSLLFIDEQSDTIPLYLNNNVDMIKV